MNELLRRARRGDESAFLEIFGKYEAELYRVAWIYVKNEADALDVMQEGAFRAFRGIRALKEPQYVKTWLTRIVINCALDQLRKNGKIVQLGMESIENDARFSTEFEKEALLRVTLDGLLNRLSADEKSAVILRYCCECTFPEMAALLNRPLGSVKTTLYRALNKLRKEAKEADLNERND